MLTTSCNLSCSGCDRLIDYNHNWVNPYDAIISDFDILSKRLSPKHFSLIGGEPLLHPKLYDIILQARKYFTNSKIELYTNGILLHKKPELLDIFRQIGKASIMITLHNRDKHIRKHIAYNIFKYFKKDLHWVQNKNEFYTEYQLGDLKLYISSSSLTNGWQMYHKVVDGKIKPFKDEDPKSSYSSCLSKFCPIVYKSRLYKCPPSSLLHTHLKKYNQLSDPDWASYASYNGIDINCSDSELEIFVKNIYKHESICGMCPAQANLQPQKEAILKHKLEAA